MRTKWNESHQRMYPICSYSNNIKMMSEKYDHALSDFTQGKITLCEFDRVKKALELFQKSVYQDIVYATPDDAELLKKYLLEKKVKKS